MKRKEIVRGRYLFVNMKIVRSGQISLIK